MLVSVNDLASIQVGGPDFFLNVSYSLSILLSLILNYHAYIFIVGNILKFQRNIVNVFFVS